MKQFSEMNLKPELVEALKRINFVTATDVQEKVIPIALSGEDVIVRAKTGTGKTCAFLIPIIQNASRHSTLPEVIIIAPTRELALQISDVATKLAARGREDVAIVYGGASINVQVQHLKRNPKFVIGTPGRIIDLIERKALRLEQIKFLVLDEADTMLDMGFLEDIEFIMSKTPNQKQTMLFSATIPQRIRDVAKSHMHNIKYLSIGAEEEIIVSKIKHYYSVSDGRLKFATLMAYIKKFSPKKAIIFVQTQHAANAIDRALREQKVHTVLMHGGLTQSKREQALKAFRGSAQLLIATNIAARGIDIVGVSDVINFDVPDDPNIYVHRVGRSARMDADGKAFSIVAPAQRNVVRDIEYVGKIQMQKIELDPRPYSGIRVFDNRNANFNRERFGRRPNSEGRNGHGGGHGRHDYRDSETHRRSRRPFMRYQR